jgi:hypothetical protein
MIALGLYLMSLGNKYQTLTLFLLGQITTATVFMLVMFVWVYPDQSEIWVVWVTLVLSLALGSGAGYATYTWGHYGILGIGVWLGSLFGSLVYGTLLRQFTSDKWHIIVLALTITAFAALAGWLSQLYLHFAIFALSSTLGSFLFFRGLSELLGGYPNEILLFERLENVSGSLPLSMYGYLLGMLVFSFAGFYFQYLVESKSLSAREAFLKVITLGGYKAANQLPLDSKAD